MDHNATIHTFAIILFMLSASLLTITKPASSTSEEIPYGVGKWSEDFGNHRARLQVTEQSDAVRIHIPWRRRDIDPQKKATIIIDAKTGKEVANVVRIEINREFGDLVFQPTSGPGEYYLYYMPFTHNNLCADWKTWYTPPQDKADPAWISNHGLSVDQLSDGKWKSLPSAQVVEIQARAEFHRFDPMEVIATAEEMKTLKADHAGADYILFPEDRRYPIRMTDDLPYRWIKSKTQNSFMGTACRNEFYAFQIGVYAFTKPIKDLSVKFDDLKSASGDVIPASALKCINIGGTDCFGHPLKKVVAVGQGKVRALWCGAQVPRDAAPGTYEGTVIIQPEGGKASTVALSLTVTNDILEDCGDKDLWRMARLRWLDSTIGMDDGIVKPYTPLEVNGKIVKCLGRQVEFAGTGLPKSIKSKDIEILSKPIEMVIETANGRLPLRAGKSKVLKSSSGTIVRESQSSAGPFAVRCLSKMDLDGYINFSITLKAKEAIDVKDIRLDIPYRWEIATYFMGLARKGSYRPKFWTWEWDQRGGPQSWTGDVNAGLQCTLNTDHGIFDAYEPVVDASVDAWRNGNKGGSTLHEADGAVVLSSYSGSRSIKVEQEIQFRFGMLVTPVKAIDTKAHFEQKHYQFYLNVVSPQEAEAHDANIVTVHQGNELNPYINYPFLTTDKLTAYVKDAHTRGMKVKEYYTVRELSNFTAEIWALRSLGDEVYIDGSHEGDSWQREHLVDRYHTGWHQEYPNGEVDAAIATTGRSRWHNYYLEGLSWLMKNVGLDGMYLDGVAFDREGTKRLRKVMEQANPNCLMDLHSGDNYYANDARSSPALWYMEHFPYLDSLWLGEVYDYDNSSPDYWLVECSGIPFGLMGDMLMRPTNPWRGMIYGMSGRYWNGLDPQYLWRFWDEFGIKDAVMTGYWDASCPVTTGHPDVLATTYRKAGKTLIVLASWQPNSPKDWGLSPLHIKLKIDWKALGLDPAKCRLKAPAIKDLQEEASFAPTDMILVEPGKGWLLVLSEAKD